MRTLHPHTRGFSLIEAITAIVVLSVAIPGMMWGIRDAQMRRVDPIQTSKARWLAAEKLEDVIADRHSGSRGFGYLVDANYPAESAVSGYAGFARSVAIAESGANLIAGSGTGYKRITISVTFKDGRNTARTLALSTVLTDYAP